LQHFFYKDLDGSHLMMFPNKGMNLGKIHGKKYESFLAPDFPALNHDMSNIKYDRTKLNMLANFNWNNLQGEEKFSYLIYNIP